ncbi:TMEM175 family protein [Streptococcus macacae]|uniref:PF06736 family protein n=1 Tax=Streptococcus macacae NCTC 11558 TaxID=764298 RepID=G5JU06_9STRE|nr:TMEM175 family protein [Streptococcus macacae]EHJ51836.1 hypothetical protein STRMA_0546 [Streptococcus macacae NCTC 11558]SUN78373.1 membrane protein [Streptococcus macacae NCTC 11558]
MTKERLVAFTDAVIAIIMTILVLDLEKPNPFTLASLWEIRNAFFAYALSFFWIGIMWVNMHKGWHDVRKISNKVVWNTVFLLFFSSFFPYVTSVVAQNFNNTIAQVCYGFIILAVTLFNTLMYRSLAEIPENTAMSEFMAERKWMKYDITMKIIGLILTITIYPPAVMYSILLIMVIFVGPMIVRDYRK